MGTMVDMFAVRMHTFVLMANHYHLLVEITEANLSRCIHWLNVSYSVWFNQRYGRSGHLLQGRFKPVLEWAPDFPAEHAGYIVEKFVRSCRSKITKGERAQFLEKLAEHAPKWENMFSRVAKDFPGK